VLLVRPIEQSCFLNVMKVLGIIFNPYQRRKEKLAKPRRPALPINPYASVVAILGGARHGTHP